MSKKKIEVEQDEIEALMRGCGNVRKLVAGLKLALGAIDMRLRATESWLATMGYRVSYAEEVEDD